MLVTISNNKLTKIVDYVNVGDRYVIYYWYITGIPLFIIESIKWEKYVVNT